MTEIQKQATIIRGPYQIAVDITNECNYRCKHCYNASGNNNTTNKEMSDDEYYNLFSDIGSMQPQNVCFCGGEPMMKLSRVCKCSNILYDSGVRSASIVSNGYFINKNTAKVLKDNHIVRVQISLDGATSQSCEALRQNPNAFEKAINAIKSLNEVGFKNTGVAMCPTKYNIEELEDVVKICEALKVRDLRLQPLMIIGRGIENANDIVPSKEQYISLVKQINYLQYKTPNVNIDWGDPLDHIYRFKDSMQDLISFISIKADGSIVASPYLPISVGNVKQHKLSEYWNAGLYKVWTLNKIKNIAERVTCIADMGAKYDDLPQTWIDDDVKIDIIDDLVFK